MAESFIASDQAMLKEQLKGNAYEPTYAGILSFMRRRYSKDLAGVDMAVWGIPFDLATTNRPGARFGPAAVRQASRMIDGDPHYPFGFDIFEDLAVVDYGDCNFDFGRPWEIPAAITAQANDILKAGAHLLTLGGDHFVTGPVVEAHYNQFGPLALVHFDAHQDTWPDDGERLDHGSMFTRAVNKGHIDPAHSIQVGIRTHAPETYGMEIIDGAQVHHIGVDEVISRIKNRVGNRETYFTFDIDCLDPAYAPGTGTPVSGGLSSAQALAIVFGLDGIDFVGGDVMEVAPAYDVGETTSLAAASVAAYYIGLIAQRYRVYKA